MPTALSSAVAAGLLLLSSPLLASAQNANRNASVVRLDLRALAAQPLPFDSRNFTQPYYVSKNGSFATTESAAGGSNITFQVSNEQLAAPILGSAPKVYELVYEPGYAWAHEAPVYFPDSDEVYVCSNAGAPSGKSNATTNNKVFKFNLGSVQSKLAQGANVTFAQDVEEVKTNSDNVQMTNGGSSYGSKLLLANSGRTERYAGNIALVDRNDPTQVEVIVNNAAGRQFNSPNDVVVSPRSGAIFFTDAYYGRTQDFRPDVELPEVVWRIDPKSGELTALTDPSMVTMPNGLVLSPNGSKLYVTDTSPVVTGALPKKPKLPASIYEFDVIEEGGIERLANRRLFAWPWTGIADGIKVDTEGNVYVGTSDGVQVWSKHGQQIFRVLMPEAGATNLVFANEGRLVVTAEEKVFLVQLDDSVRGPPLWNYPKQGQGRQQEGPQ